MKKLIAVLIIIILPALIITGCKPSNNGNIIKIAFVSPLTGDVAAMGQGMKNGAMLAIEDANNKYKDLGFTFELMPLDDRADPKEAVNAANQIISDKNVYGIIGHLNSGCSIPASAVYNKRNMVMISPASTNPKLTQQGLENVFRLCTTDDVQGTFAADRLLKIGLKNIAVIHDKTPYGQGLAEEFKKTIEAGNGKVLSFEGISMGDKDFNAILIKMKTLRPDAIYFGGMYQEGGLLSRQAKEMGLRVPVIGGDGLYTSEYIKIAGIPSEGDMTTSIGLPPEKLPKSKEFISKYTAKYPNYDMQPYDPTTYDATALLAYAIVQAKKDKSKILEIIKNVKFDGVTGPVQFDKKGDTLNKAVTMYIVKNGKWIVKE